MQHAEDVKCKENWDESLSVDSICKMTMKRYLDAYTQHPLSPESILGILARDMKAVMIRNQEMQVMDKGQFLDFMNAYHFTNNESVEIEEVGEFILLNSNAPEGRTSQMAPVYKVVVRSTQKNKLCGPTPYLVNDTVVFGFDNNLDINLIVHNWTSNSEYSSQTKKGSASASQLL
jgi:hypothetical protein